MKHVFRKILFLFISISFMACISHAEENIVQLDPRKIVVETGELNGSYEINIFYEGSLIMKVTKDYSKHLTSEGISILAMEKRPIEGIQYLNFTQDEVKKIIRIWNQSLVEKIINNEMVEIDINQWDRYSPEKLFGQSKNSLRNVPKNEISFEPILTGTTFGKKYKILVKILNKPVALLQPSDQFLSKFDTAFKWGAIRLYFKENEMPSIIQKLQSQVNQSAEYVTFNLKNESENIVQQAVTNSCEKIFVF